MVDFFSQAANLEDWLRPSICKMSSLFNISEQTNENKKKKEEEEEEATF